MTARLAATMAIAVLALPASAQEGCGNWNTRGFFRNATVESVMACLEAGADLNARTDSTFDDFMYSGVRGGDTPLHFASAFSGDRVVALLLEAGADVNARDLRGGTPLHAAARRDWDPAAVVAKLVEAGADPDARDSEGNTPLHASRRNRNPVVALLLLELGADPALVNDSGRVASPTDCAYWNTEEFARVATAEVTAACIDAGADVNARDENGNTPLLLATGNWAGTMMDGSPASEGPAVVTTLLEAGADVNARNSWGSSALGRASRGKAVTTVRGGMLDLVEIPDIVAVLLAAGAEVNAPSGTTPLHQAALVEGLETVTMLIEAGADIHARDDSGDTPLLRAADYGGFRNPEIIDVLVEAGADVNDRNEHGWTVLERALGSPADRVAAVVRRLLDLGADANAPGVSSSPLHRAASRDDNPEIVRMLLAAGAEVNDHGSSNPLHAAARGGGPAVIATLVAAGAEVDAPDRGGQTPLHRAVKAKKSANVAALIEAGGDVHAPAYDGNTPLHLTARWPRRFGSREGDPRADTLMVVALVAAGADIDARNEHGETPLHSATRNRHQPVVDKLLALGADPVAVDSLGRFPRPEVCDWTKSRFFRSASWESVIGCLRAGADVHARGEHGETPLHRLVSEAPPDDYPLARVVAAFVEAGADVNEPDRGGGTPLHNAVGRFGNRTVPATRALLAAGAAVNARDSRGETPLHRLAGAEFTLNDSLVSLLVEAGADVHATDEGGRTALHDALRRDNPAIAARLIELGSEVAARDDSGHVADPVDCARFNTATFFHLASTATVAGCIERGADVNAVLEFRFGRSNQISGSTPLHFASAWGGDPAIVSLLVRAGADVNALNGSGASPLHSAAERTDDPAMIVALAEAGAELDAWVPGIHSPHGWTALHLAAQRNRNPAVTTALIEAGADVHATRNDGPTPLHDAATAAVVALLLAAGADIEARAAYLMWRQPNGRDMTPLHVAAKRGNAAVFMALLEAGADPSALDIRGNTPLDYAREQESLRELEVVKRSGS